MNNYAIAIMLVPVFVILVRYFIAKPIERYMKQRFPHNKLVSAAIRERGG